MGFFIRKAISAEPVQFNLSNGGEGSSAGITGARIGANRKGTYAYGGRYGLYFRKQFFKSGRKNRGKSPSVQTDGSTDILVDSGQTYSPVYDLIEPRLLPVYPEVKGIHKHPLMWLLLLFSLAVPLFISEPSDPFAWVLTGILLFSMAAGLIYNRSWIRKGKHLIELMSETFEKEPDRFTVEPMKEFIRKAPDKYVNRFLPDLFFILLRIVIEAPDDRYIFPFNKFEKQLPLSEDFISETKKAALAGSLDSVLADHMLSTGEEKSIRELIHKLYLDDRFVFEILQYLNLASLVRKEFESPLNKLKPAIPVLQEEICYGEYDSVRLLDKRVVERLQKERITYRNIGFDAELEGKLVLTNMRVILSGEEGSREYRMNKIVDVITDLETNTTELVISGRKTPVIFAAQSPLLISSRIEKILQEIVRNQPEEVSAD